MKILLINPSQKTVYGKPLPQIYPPLGLLYIAAVLENKKQYVRVLDIDAEKINDEKLIKIFKEIKPDLVGFTATTSIFNSAVYIAKTLKNIKNIPIIIGGIHPTIATEEVIKNPEFDFVVKGEAEHTISEFIDLFEKGKTDFNVDGLWYKKQGKIIKNKDRMLIENLDELPFPARHLLKEPNAYIPADALRKPIMSIMTSRGCYGACTYCCTKQIFGRNIRFRSIQNVIAEIEDGIKKYGIKEIHIADDNFIANKKRTLDFCDEITKRKLDLTFVFFNGFRADNVDKEILIALKKIGVISVGYGVESGNQQVLNKIKKGITLDTVRKTFKISKELGFEVWGFFMLGLPGDTDESIRDTINFAKEIDPDFAKFLIFKPFPGSEAFMELSKGGYILNHDYQNYGVYTDAVHYLPTVSSEKINKWQGIANREYYLRPKKILEHILRIKSFTQLKINIKSALFLLSRSK